jgi:hypothetical protein
VPDKAVVEVVKTGDKSSQQALDKAIPESVLRPNSTLADHVLSIDEKVRYRVVIGYAFDGSEYGLPRRTS